MSNDTNKDVKRLLNAVMRKFIDNVDIEQDGLLDELIAEGVLNRQDHDSLRANHHPTTRDRARNLLQILRSISHKKFVSKALPVLCAKVGYLIPEQFWKTDTSGQEHENAGLCEGEGETCMRCSIKQRVRLPDLADLLLVFNIISDDVYREMTRHYSTAPVFWEPVFSAFRDLSKELTGKLQPQVEQILLEHSVDIHRDLSSLMVRGFPCQCSGRGAGKDTDNFTTTRLRSVCEMASFRPAVLHGHDQQEHSVAPGQSDANPSSALPLLTPEASSAESVKERKPDISRDKTSVDLKQSGSAAQHESIRLQKKRYHETWSFRKRHKPFLGQTSYSKSLRLSGSERDSLVSELLRQLNEGTPVEVTGCLMESGMSRSANDNETQGQQDSTGEHVESGRTSVIQEKESKDATHHMLRTDCADSSDKMCLSFWINAASLTGEQTKYCVDSEPSTSPAHRTSSDRTDLADKLFERDQQSADAVTETAVAERSDKAMSDSSEKLTDDSNKRAADDLLDEIASEHSGDTDRYSDEDEKYSDEDTEEEEFSDEYSDESLDSFGLLRDVISDEVLAGEGIDENAYENSHPSAPENECKGTPETSGISDKENDKQETGTSCQACADSDTGQEDFTTMLEQIKLKDCEEKTIRGYQFDNPVYADQGESLGKDSKPQKPVELQAEVIEGARQNVYLQTFRSSSTNISAATLQNLLKQKDTVDSEVQEKLTGLLDWYLEQEQQFTRETCFPFQIIRESSEIVVAQLSLDSDSADQHAGLREDCENMVTVCQNMLVHKKTIILCLLFLCVRRKQAAELTLEKTRWIVKDLVVLIEADMREVNNKLHRVVKFRGLVNVSVTRFDMLKIQVQTFLDGF